ncbi:MAG: MATE family efflux transporter, partial [Prevotella sp.]|nr:MATE family efflux transporter [Prevotella sp.]
MKDNRDSIDFGKEPVGKIFRKMFLPTLVAMVTMVVLNITDGAFVGHGVGSDALAAVSIIAPVFLFIAGIGLMFGIGGSVVASIHLSKGKVKAARINITQSLIGGFLVGCILGGLIVAFQRETCLLFGSSEKLIP